MATPNDNDVEDCWDVFGSDSDDDDEEQADGENVRGGAGETAGGGATIVVASYLSQAFLLQNNNVGLSERRVLIINSDVTAASAGESEGRQYQWGHCIEQRGIRVVYGDAVDSFLVDAILYICTVAHPDATNLNECFGRLLPGGVLVTNKEVAVGFEDDLCLPPTPVYVDKQRCLLSWKKRATHVHASMCPWLPPSHSTQAEQDRLSEASVTLSTYETCNSTMTEVSIRKAVDSLKHCGYCIIRQLLDPSTSRQWGQAVLASVHDAAQILLRRDQVDIYHPHISKFEPQAYKEMSMREDLRLDLRSGPQLSNLRRVDDPKGDEPVVINALQSSLPGFLRGHPSLLEIVRRTMNPKRGDLFKGNYGRYNFNGSGPDGSFQSLRVSPVGGIVSFPGAADQAIHSDTPHLFEHIPDLPAHYINIFAPGTPFHPSVGGTAFCHGSHNLEFTAKYCSDEDNNNLGKVLSPFLVRPCLTLGDVVLFDCRIIHFGLANNSTTSDDATDFGGKVESASPKRERVVLYTNTTQAWFHDPKNWDDRCPIFD